MDGGEEGDGVEEGVQLLELRGWVGVGVGVGFGGGFLFFVFCFCLCVWGFFCCLLFVVLFCGSVFWFLVSRFCFCFFDIFCLSCLIFFPLSLRALRACSVCT